MTHPNKEVRFSTLQKIVELGLGGRVWKDVRHAELVSASDTAKGERLQRGKADAETSSA
ncbi:MAG: hypothetical protein ABI723_04500 [Bacteroidia bacterium]